MQQRYLVIVDLLDRGHTNFNIVFASSGDDATRQALVGLSDDIGEVNVLAEEFPYTNEPARGISGYFDRLFMEKRRGAGWTKHDISEQRLDAAAGNEAEGPTRTVSQWAQLAIDIQNASNMGGVSIAFRELVAWLHRQRGEGRGTAWVNTHPLVRLFADKIADLSGAYDSEAMRRAHVRVEAMRDGEGLN